MRDYYEQLWASLPAELEPGVDFAARRAFLLANVRAGQTVLDLGCGEGAFSGVLAAAGALPIGVDVADAALGRARGRHPGLEFRLAPYDGPLPLDDASCDAVWASEVIEHVADTARWLSEVRRVLRSGGVLLVTTPWHGRATGLAILLGGFERRFDPRGDHLRFYSRRALAELLGDFGFEDVELSATGPPLLRRTLLARARRAGLVGSAAR